MGYVEPLIWPYHVAGALCIAVASVAFVRLFGLRKAGQRAHPSIIACVGIVFVVGAASVAIGIDATIDWTTTRNTRSLTYNADVTVDGSRSVRLVLPAPLEARFWSALNVTEGNASLRFERIVGEPAVVLTTSGNASFRIYAALVAPSIDSSLSRLELDEISYGQARALINLTSLSPGTGSVQLDLDVGIGSFCGTQFLDLQQEIFEGTSYYEAVRGAVVC